MRVYSLLLAFALIVSSSASAQAGSDFCAGFDRGYVTGYKKASGSGFDPFTPFCPFQPFKDFSDPESDFEQGYLIGLEQGLKEGQK